MANDSRVKRHIVAMPSERVAVSTATLRTLSVCSPSIIYAIALPARLLPPSLPRRRPTIMLFMPAANCGRRLAARPPRSRPRSSLRAAPLAAVISLRLFKSSLRCPAPTHTYYGCAFHITEKKSKSITSANALLRFFPFCVATP